MTRVLLTGAGGFVGHHTLEHLLVNTDWEIVCTDSFRHAGKTDRISEVLIGQSDNGFTWGRVKVVTHDLTAPFSAQLADKIGPVDAIISMASESHVDRSISHPVPFIRNNIDLVLNLLEFQKTFNPEAIFLQVSTDEVYGPAPEGHNHGEWEPHLPSNPYSASKSAQEQIAFSYWRTFGVPLILTSTMNIIGERQDPEKYVPMLIQKILYGQEVTIHASPDGQPGSRFYLHARNQADALLFLLEKYLADPSVLKYKNGDTKPEKFNVVGEKEIDNLELAQLVAKFVDNDLKYRLVDFHSQRPGHDLRYALDGSKIAALGWKAPVSLEDSLKQTVEWSLKNPAWLLP
jgi:dTDP-glucose 4,6-dehydratase